MAVIWRYYGSPMAVLWSSAAPSGTRKHKRILKPKIGHGTFGSLRVPGCCLTKNMIFFVLLGSGTMHSRVRRASVRRIHTTKHPSISSKRQRSYRICCCETNESSLHCPHVSARPRKRILELRLVTRLALALSCSLNLALSHHNGGTVRREGSCHRARPLFLLPL